MPSVAALSRRSEWQGFDNFPTDGPLGSAQVGGAWTVSQAVPSDPIIPVVNGGVLRYTDESRVAQATYPSLYVGQTVRNMGCIASFHGTENADYGSLGLLVSANPTDGDIGYITDGPCLHVIWTPSKVDIGFFASGALQVPFAPNYPGGACAIDGTKYRFEMWMDAARNEITIAFPTGGSHTFKDSRISSYVGRTVTWEHFAYAPPSGTTPKVRFDRVWAL